MKRADHGRVFLLLLPAILLGGFGGAILWLDSHISARDEAMVRWPHSQGKLISLRIMEIPGVKVRTCYQAFLEYEYRVGNQDFHGKAISGKSSDVSLDALKKRLAQWIDDPLTVMQDHSTPLAKVYDCIPVAQRVTVHYDPANPQDAVVKFAPYSTGGSTIARTFGFVLCGLALGTFCLAIVTARDDSRPVKRDLSNRQPTVEEITEFTRLVDAAIDALRHAMVADGKPRDDVDNLMLSLRSLKEEPAISLRSNGRLGYNRWLSGDWGMDDWGPAWELVCDTAIKVEEFHGAFHSRE